jgi:hypothetical protein
MRIRILIVLAVLAVAAIAGSVPASGQSNVCPPGTTDTTYCQTVAPGQYCKGVSKKKIPGQKKTPFAQCVTAMAKINKKPSLSPTKTCAGLKTIKGKKNQTKKNKSKAKKAFNGCVKGGKKLKLDLANAKTQP